MSKGKEALPVCDCGAIVDEAGGYFRGRHICRNCLPRFTREELPRLVRGRYKREFPRPPRPSYRVALTEERVNPTEALA